VSIKASVDKKWKVVSELGIAELIGKERVPVGQFVWKANVDESRLRESTIP